MISERIKNLEALSRQRAAMKWDVHFNYDLHSSALGEYAHLPHAERLARSMAYAIANQDAIVFEDDRIGGRIYHTPERATPQRWDVLDFDGCAQHEFLRRYPEAEELFEDNLISTSARGHVSWSFSQILEHGTDGCRQIFLEAEREARDDTAREFYRGVVIMLDALDAFNDKHISEYERLGNLELVDRMRRVPRYPARSFKDAVQSFFMQHIVVMRENPYGGNSPGRLDYYLWPYLKRDIESGEITLDEAKEIIDELFLRIDERIHVKDGWVEAVVVGGTAKDGTSSVNPLTYIMVRSIIDLNVTHPSVYIRVPENPTDELISLCTEFLTSGNNRAQILNDPAVIGAMTKNGVEYADAVEYACGGCMEISVQGMSSDLLYVGWQNTPKMLELMITGGECLLTGRRYSIYEGYGALSDYGSFDAFYKDFVKVSGEITELFLREQEVYSEIYERNRPSYLMSSMIDNCLARGRNMHGGGAKYHDYGGTHIGLPNVVDALYAIKRAVFEDRICTADELIAALRANFAGYEKLRARLGNLPRYGMDDPDVDSLALRVMSDFSDMYNSYRTRWGGRGKPIILTFVYAPRAAERLGATADGRYARSMVAQGVTPASHSMQCGLTSAINSCTRMPFDSFSGGASTMWDFDAAYATADVVGSVLRTFLARGGQIFQGNTAPVEELIRARETPDEYSHLIVRVGGFSARFINLSPELQDEIINRYRHNG